MANCGSALSGFWLCLTTLVPKPWDVLLASIKKSGWLYQFHVARAELDSYDLDLPLEVDDEYWETSNPAEAFKQPLGVPSEASAFRWFIKIGWIMNFTHKTLVSITSSQRFFPEFF